MNGEAILDWVDSEGLSEEIIFKMRPAYKGDRHEDLQKTDQGRVVMQSL